jgi:hyperosmotically inducible periplasmic protein
MKKVILFLVLSLSVVLGLAMFPGCAMMKGETTGEYIDDSTITTQVNQVIVKDPDAQYFKINVTTTQGDVVLQGFVNSRDTEDRIVANIKQIRGVKAVNSLLKSEEGKMKGETTGEYIDDTTITAQVNQVIVKDPDAQYFKINVTTTQGDVVLQGFVYKRGTEDRLVDKIKQIRGVKSVKSLLKIEERK